MRRRWARRRPELRVGLPAILKIKLAAIDEEHDAELAVHDVERDAIDAKAEAQALSAVFDFLKDCKIAVPD